MMKALSQQPLIVHHRPAFHIIHKIPQPVLRHLPALLKKLGCQHGRQGKGHKQGKHASKDNSQSELAEKLACHAGHKGNRQKSHRIAQSNGNSCHADFIAPLLRCHLRLFTHLQMPDDIFQHHDGVIHQNTDAQGHAHQGHHVEGKTGYVHNEKGGNQGSRNSHHNRCRRTPAPQEQEKHQPRGTQALHQCSQRIVQGSIHIIRIIADHRKGIIRILLPQLRQLLVDIP